jgi:conjugal transfer pilus assembly protein TraW
MRKSLSTFLLVSLVTHGASAATRIGPTYPIVEPDLLEEIQTKATAMQKSGEIDRIQNESKKRAENFVKNPPPVEGVTKTGQKRVFYFDPTVVANQDILGSKGELIVPVGTQANPLDYQDFGEPMLFFDARDPVQVSFAEKLIKKRKNMVMPVLTGGSYMDLMQKWKKRVFYDQRGLLTKRLRIKSVPALVSQEGNKLKIEEFAL